MTIRFTCPHCRKGLSAPDRSAGVRTRCPGCKGAVVVPTAAPPQAAAGKRSRAPAAPRASAAPRPEELAEEPTLRFRRRLPLGEGLDMTPMVDVTFLLLIFFMVTASLAPQKSLEVPTPDQPEHAAQARTIEELEEDDDYVIISIEGDNSVWVDDIEAPSEQELLVRLREARQGVAGARGPSNLLVLADGDARHETVVMALDAGNAVGMESVRLATADDLGY